MARTRQQPNWATERAVRGLDDLALYEEFKEALLPKLRRWVLEDRSADWMRRECAALVQAQMISKALRGDLRALKDTLDRHEGTAIKRVESKTVYAQMSKQELAALAYQKLQDAGLINRDGKVIEASAPAETEMTHSEDDKT